MKSTVDGVAAAGLRDSVKMMIGGATMDDENVRAYMGPTATGQRRPGHASPARHRAGPRRRLSARSREAARRSPHRKLGPRGAPALRERRGQEELPGRALDSSSALARPGPRKIPVFPAVTRSIAVTRSPASTFRDRDEPSYDRRARLRRAVRTRTTFSPTSTSVPILAYPAPACSRRSDYPRARGRATLPDDAIVPVRRSRVHEGRGV